MKEDGEKRGELTKEVMKMEDLDEHPSPRGVLDNRDESDNNSNFSSSLEVKSPENEAEKSHENEETSPENEEAKCPENEEQKCPENEEESSPSPSLLALEENHINGVVQWKNMFDSIRKKSVRRLSSIALLNVYEQSRKSLRWKIGRNHASEDSIDCGEWLVPKPSWRNFSYHELEAATKKFSPDKLLGKGGHAEVYKGRLPDGQIVAVKRITKKEKKDEDRVGEYLSELGIIAHINHPNAAKLIGFSIDNGLYLVLQFAPNGSLGTLLHGSSSECIDWNIRFKIALGVADGLKYLHSDCQRRIIHRDITASNILLAEDYVPQISDFGLAKWLPDKWVHHVVSPIEGTFGYMAPEYFMHGIVHEKTDVFAFGVLLLELITGRRSVDSCRQSLAIWAKPLMENNNIKELADGRLGDDYDNVDMKRAILAASMCLHHSPDMRPTMSRVVQLLRGESGPVEMKQKSIGGKSVVVDACDIEDYNSTTYLKDLDRHKELVMQ